LTEESAQARHTAGIGRPGFIARHRLWSEAQTQAAGDLLQRARQGDLRTIRLAFADQHGVLRGKTVVADMLEGVLSNGCSMTTTLLLKDTAQKTVYPVWRGGSSESAPGLRGASDFVWVPDPTTFRRLPWSPGAAWLLGDCYFQDGTPVPFCTRHLCRRALERLSARGLRFLAGLELEFHIFRLADPRLEPRDCGQPPQPPDVRMLAHGYQYLADNRFDELEPVLEELRATLLALGLPLRTMEVEMGPSQCELTFAAVEGLAGADNVVLARGAIKQVCRRSGYHATFMCRPALANIASSGWHLHQSLTDAATGDNAFVSSDPSELLSPCGRQFVAGLLENARAACILAVPTINGYKRFRPYSLAPDRVVWGADNRGAMVRVLGAPCDPMTHLENRIGESAANPYLYFSSQVVSGLDGVTRELEPPMPADAPYDAAAQALPASLVEAIGEWRQSSLFRRELGDAFVDYLVRIKEFEVHRFLSEEVTDWEQREYFELM